MWRQLIENIVKVNSYAKLNPPATVEDISEVEAKLKVKLPNQIKELLLEVNGDNDFILSTKQIIRDNLEIRGIKEYKNVDRLLFVARNGCGDFYSHLITDANVKNEIFFWDHETDEYILKANDLKDIIQKYCNREI